MPREEQILAEIRSCLRGVSNDLRGYRVVLFGSRACGNARPRSDFDVGVLGPRNLPPRTFHKIGDLLDEIPTLYAIDWVDLTAAAESFRREAMKQTELLYHG